MQTRPTIEKLITVDEVATTDRDELVALMSDDYDALCTVAVAEALNRATPEIAALLRSPEWCEQWLDALRGIVGTLQVGVERMRYELGGGHAKTRKNQRRLRRVRARVDEARQVVRALHRGPAEIPGTTVAIKTRQWLCDLLAEEFEALFQAELAAAGCDPDPRRPPASDADLFPWAVHHGFLVAPVSPRCRQLLEAPPLELRNVVADDAKRQQHREPALRHPLLVVRWGELLLELRHMIADHLGLDGDLSGGIPTAQVDLRSLPQEEAFAHLNRAAVLRRDRAASLRAA